MNDNAAVTESTGVQGQAGSSAGAGGHSEGPWRAFIGGRNGSIVQVNQDSETEATIVHWSGFDNSGVPLDQQHANARLIAAAPDLLAELRAVLAWATVEGAALREQEIESVRAAIARATNGASHAEQ